MTKKERAALAVETLKRRYPQAQCSLTYQKPHELLIATRLSAQCTDARVNIVTKDLFAAYPTIDSFAEADAEEIEPYIRPCGLYKTKAKDIVTMCRQLRDEFHYEMPQTIEELTSLSGIGRKTANLMLGDIFGKPAVVTDTHCIRICGRLGLTNEADPYKVEMDLRKILDPKESNDFCHRLVHFGREVCKARSPQCEGCECAEFCKNKGKSKK
ncbi:MAG: endonuclease III [Oscillospiraceae bacterium]|nr:endonuclease III [Oscillospiraceae bacterium]